PTGFPRNGFGGFRGNGTAAPTGTLDAAAQTVKRPRGWRGMRVGVIGSGQVGQILAAGFQAKGHDVVVGTRDPKKSLAETKPGPMGQQPLGAWAKANPKVKVGTMDEAAKHGEVLVFAVHGANVAEAVKQAGPDNLAG